MTHLPGLPWLLPRRSTQPQPPASIFVPGYQKLIAQVRSVYPATTELFLICGPVIGDPCCANVQTVVAEVGSLLLPVSLTVH